MLVRALAAVHEQSQSLSQIARASAKSKVHAHCARDAARVVMTIQLVAKVAKVL